MNTNLINIGIVGTGRVAHRLANAINLLVGANLWSVCSRNTEDAQKFATEYNAVSTTNAYNDFKKMINDPSLNAIIIATPDHVHFHYALESLKKGKHVLIEKPLCTEIEDGRQLVELAKNSNCIAAVGYHLRWHPALRILADKIKSSEFGQINHVSINWAHTFIEEAKWRKSTTDARWWSQSTLGTHCLDILRWLLLPKCGEVKRIQCMTTNKNFNGNDESAMMNLEFESGATAQIFTSILFHTPFQIEIYGEKNHVYGERLTSSTEKGKLFINDLPIEYSLGSQNFYICELNNFIGAINGKNSIEVPISEGFRNIELLLKG